MSNENPRPNARYCVSLSLERIPQFRGQAPSDRMLFETVNTLNRRLMQGPRRSRETSTEALERLGFLRKE